MKTRLLIFAALFVMIPRGEAQSSLPGWYVKGEAGVNLVDFTKKDGRKYEFSSGYIIGGSVGYKFPYSIRSEGEITFRENKFDRETLYDVDQYQNHVGVPLEGELRSFALMANLFYDIPGDWPVVPYVGVGGGHLQYEAEWIPASEQLRADFHLSEKIPFEGKGFAYQGIAGLNYQYLDSTDFRLEYRYLDGRDLQKNHAFILTLKQYF